MLQVNKWGSHDVKYLNAVMKIPQMAEVRVSVYDELNKVHLEEFLWSSMKRLGLHDVAGHYFSLDLFYRDFVFNLEFCGEDDLFVYKVTPSKGDKNIKFYITGILRWGVGGSVAVAGERITIETGGQKDIITVIGDFDRTTRVNAVHAGLLVESTGPVYIRCNHSMEIPEMEAFLNAKRDKAWSAQTKSGGVLEDSCEAIVKGLLWNTFYDPSLESMCTVISRQWCNGIGQQLFGSYILADWDTFFAGLMSSIQDKKLAYLQVYSILGQVTERGFVPNVGSQRGKSEDRSQPPVGAYCVYKLYKQFGERKLLEDTFDILLRWHRWWPVYRDGNRDGLLEWGSDPFPGGEYLGYNFNNLDSAKLESGLDNSPMYDEAVFNTETNTMELSDIGLNSFFALASWALARIASELGRSDLMSELDDEYERMKYTINESLWNEEKGIYLNRHWDERFSYRMSPTCFYPMLAGIASESQAKRMVEEHLLNPEEFWGEYVIPSSPKSEKEFEDNAYWRGRIWGPMNFLVGEGLKRYGFNKAAHSMADKSLKLFRKEWVEKGHIHENYNTITGEGDDVASSDPLYHWGGLLPYMAVSEIIEVQPWAGLRFGNLSGEPATVENYPVGGDLYSVAMGDGLKVYKNGKVLLEASCPVLLTDYKIEGSIMQFSLLAEKPAKLTVHETQGISKIMVNTGIGLCEYDTEGSFVNMEFLGGYPPQY